MQTLSNAALSRSVCLCVHFKLGRVTFEMCQSGIENVFHSTRSHPPCVLAHCNGVRNLGLGHQWKLGGLCQKFYLYDAHVKWPSTGGHIRVRTAGRQTSNIPPSIHPEYTSSSSTGCHKHRERDVRVNHVRMLSWLLCKHFVMLRGPIWIKCIIIMMVILCKPTIRHPVITITSPYQPLRDTA